MSDRASPPTLGPHFTKLRKIGQGGFATVYEATCPKVSISVAIKSIPRFRLLDNRYRQLFETELKILEAVDHPFIVMFYNLISDDDTFNLVMEYCSESVSRLVSDGRRPEPQVVEKYFCQLVAAVHYLHRELRVVHRDLKLENLLVDAHGNLKVTDFGLSKALSEPDEMCHTACGTEPYLAPELVRNEPYTEKVDIWQLGVVLYVLSFGKFPFACGNEAKMMSEIQTKEPEFPGDADPALCDLIGKLLTKDARLRPRIEDVIGHAWVKRSAFCVFAEWPLSAYPNLTVGLELDRGVEQEIEQMGYSKDSITELGTDDAMFYRMIKRREISRVLAKGWLPKDVNGSNLEHPTLRTQLPARSRVQSLLRGENDHSILGAVMRHLGKRCGDVCAGRPASGHIMMPVVQMADGRSVTKRTYSKSTLLVKNYRFKPKNRIV